MKMRLLILAIMLLCSCEATKTNASERLLDRVCLVSSQHIRTKVGQGVQLKIEVPEGLEATFSWSINDKVFSVEQNPIFTPSECGVGRIMATVKSRSGASKRLMTTFFVAKDNEYQVLAYQPSWRGYKDRNWDKITHMCMCFGKISGDGSINIDDLKRSLGGAIGDAHQNGVYVLLSVGGGDADGGDEYGFTVALSEDRTRKKLVDNIVKVVVDLDLDGVDVDYEHWDYSLGEANRVRSANLEKFYRELREGLPVGYLQTTAIGLFALNNGCFTDTMHQYLDFVNLMIYDATGPWEFSGVGPHADWDFYLASIAGARKVKIPDHKIVAGVPFYGVNFLSGESSLGAVHISYGDICKRYEGAENKNWIEGEHIYYDGKPMVESKAKYVMSEKLGGIMVWELTQDSDNQAKSLLVVVDSVLGAKN